MHDKARRVSHDARDDDPNVWSEYEIEAQTSLVDRPLRNLKHGDAFAVLDSLGDIGTAKNTPEGLFFRDTRYLSYFELRIEGKRPLLLSSAVLEDKAALSIDLTNPDLQTGDNQKLARDTILIERTKFLWKAVCYERIKLKNYASVPVRIGIDVLFGADFHDLFEVRGMKRRHRGRTSTHLVTSDRVEIQYEGLDGIVRRAVLAFSPAPDRILMHRCNWIVELAPVEQKTLFVRVACAADEAPLLGDFFLSYRDAHRARRASIADIAKLASSNGHFDEVVSRAVSDIYTLATRTEFGLYPYAGIPWFSTVFGRDGIITAMLMLWMDPAIARGVLRMLAALQATGSDAASDAQPGKILHEIRQGEMANLGEVPFRRYYGSIDATPLFLLLAGMYFERTGDRDTIAAIWPNIEAALGWIDAYGDRDGDGFVEYFRETANGLANQGWKDSYDAIFHADGSLAAGPIALCEVQGYVFGAWREVAGLAAALGKPDLAARLESKAETLRARFETVFWCEDIGTYALALDGDKNRCRVRSSNAGHALFSGIASPARAAKIATSLMTPEGFSGWGVRTIAHGEARYNPMSYHNGSVWPHDNALVALGFARYGMNTIAARILEGIFAAGAEQDMQRMPELFCGFNRRPHRAPTSYPVACSPQAWAAASIFGLLGACLGLQILHRDDTIRLVQPILPRFLDSLTITNLRVNASRIDLRLSRTEKGVGADVLARSGSANVVLE